MRSFCVFILIVVFFVGCTADSTPKMPSNPFSKNAKKSPARLVDVWNTYAQTDAEGGRPIRGLAGRVLFYPEGKAKQPIKVNGRLTVFLFDGDERDPKHAKPLRQYVFPAETLHAHYSKKEPIGHGYDFYLPFDGIDGEERTLCVLTRFDDAIKGQLVLSQPVITVLQGRKPDSRLPEGMRENREMLAKTTPQNEASSDATRPVSQAGALEQEVARLQSELDRVRREEIERRTVATIGLPERFVNGPNGANVTGEMERRTSVPNADTAFLRMPTAGTGTDETTPAGTETGTSTDSTIQYTAFGQDAHLAMQDPTGRTNTPNAPNAPNAVATRNARVSGYPASTYPAPNYPSYPSPLTSPASSSSQQQQGQPTIAAPNTHAPGLPQR